MKQPYGVPFRCLLPVGIDNLAIEYHLRAEELRLKKPAPPAPNQAQPSPQAPPPGQ